MLIMKLALMDRLALLMLFQVRKIPFSRNRLKNVCYLALLNWHRF